MDLIGVSNCLFQSINNQDKSCQHSHTRTAIGLKESVGPLRATTINQTAAHFDLAILHFST